MKYKVKVTEKYSKIIEVEAEGKEKALDIASSIEINMEPEDYVSDSFEVEIIKE